MCITNCFSETQVLLSNIYEHCFVIIDFMHRHIFLVIVCISVRIFWYPLLNLAVNLYVTRVCLINHFIVTFCYSPFYYM